LIIAGDDIVIEEQDILLNRLKRCIKTELSNEELPKSLRIFSRYYDSLILSEGRLLKLRPFFAVIVVPL
jgi:hypothetical protein